MSTYNPNTLGPNLPFPERAEQIYGYIDAANPRREGTRYASEQLVERGRLAGSFVGGAGPEGERRYLAAIAHGRSPLADDLRDPGATRGPTWDYLDDATLTGFRQGTVSAPGHAYPHPWQPRDGHNRPLAPTFGFNQGERPTTVYEKIITPPQGGRGRRSPADISNK